MPDIVNYAVPLKQYETWWNPRLKSLSLSLSKSLSFFFWWWWWSGPQVNTDSAERQKSVESPPSYLTSSSCDTNLPGTLVKTYSCYDYHFLSSYIQTTKWSTESSWRIDQLLLQDKEACLFISIHFRPFNKIMLNTSNMPSPWGTKQDTMSAAVWHPYHQLLKLNKRKITKLLCLY
jgi:hypothetical protein